MKSFVKIIFMVLLIFCASRCGDVQADSPESSKTVKTVIISSANSPADVVIAVPVANSFGTELVLADEVNLDSPKYKEFGRSVVVGGDKRIKITGSKEKICDRISGQDRFETSIKVFEFLKENKKIDSVNITSGESLVDATIADSSNNPIILVDRKLSKKKISQINQLLTGYNKVIIGGRNFIPKELIYCFGAVEVSGENRYETSKKYIDRVLYKSDNYVETFDDDIVENALMANKAFLSGESLMIRGFRLYFVDKAVDTRISASDIKDVEHIIKKIYKTGEKGTIDSITDSWIEIDGTRYKYAGENVYRNSKSIFLRTGKDNDVLTDDVRLVSDFTGFIKKYVPNIDNYVKKEIK